MKTKWSMICSVQYQVICSIVGEMLPGVPLARIRCLFQEDDSSLQFIVAERMKNILHFHLFTCVLMVIFEL